MYNYKWNEKCLYNYIDVFVVFLNPNPQNSNKHCGEFTILAASTYKKLS